MCLHPKYLLKRVMYRNLSKSEGKNTHMRIHVLNISFLIFLTGETLNKVQYFNYYNPVRLLELGKAAIGAVSSVHITTGLSQ